MNIEITGIVQEPVNDSTIVIRCVSWHATQANVSTNKRISSLRSRPMGASVTIVIHPADHVVGMLNSVMDNVVITINSEIVYGAVANYIVAISLAVEGRVDTQDTVPHSSQQYKSRGTVRTRMHKN